MTDKEKDSSLEWTTRLRVSSRSRTKEKGLSHRSLMDRERSTEEQVSSLTTSAVPGEIFVLEDHAFVEEAGKDPRSSQKDQDRLISLRHQETANKPVAPRKYTPFEDEEELLLNAQSSTVTEAIPTTEAPLALALKDKDRDLGGGGKRRNLRRTLATFADAPKKGTAVEKEGLAVAAVIQDDIDDDLQLTLKRPKIHHRVLPPPSPHHWNEEPNYLMSMEAHPESVPRGTSFISEATELAMALEQKTRAIMAENPISPKREGTTQIEPQPQPQSSDTSIAANNLPLVPTDIYPPSTVPTVPEKDAVFVQQEPLVRRGVAATLEFLARLGIRPQLCSELLPPQQRPAPTRFAHLRLEHRDEEGNLLTAKEAYKLLSHRFHGKGPGKSKQERLARKRAEEQRRLAAPLADTPLGMGASLRERQRTTGSTHIVLAEGARAASVGANPMTPAEVTGDVTANGGTRRAGKRPSERSSGTAVKKLPKVFGMK